MVTGTLTGTRVSTKLIKWAAVVAFAVAAPLVLSSACDEGRFPGPGPGNPGIVGK